MLRSGRLHFWVSGFCFLAVAILWVSPAAGERDFGLSIYTGRLTGDNWGKTITGRSNFSDTTLVIAGLGWTFKRAQNRSWSLELESNVGKHFGAQDHWEGNGLVSARWHKFPWNNVVATSTAFGTGLSYATEKPKVEAGDEGTTERLLVYWQAEFSFGLPRKDWAILFRIHHRSTGFGLLGDDGGSNALLAGVRFFF